MLDEYGTEDEFRRAIAEELAGLENIGHRIGGGFVVTPLRRPVLRGEVTVFETVGWHFKQVFMPAARPAEAEPETPSVAADEEPAAPAAAE
ncbi:hypothetical protein [Baekduia alba]|uniref:hypothetical protein n=1 Tax=Baekduia alba TaxID=2997333 RepID=UPI002341190A|nr:hypothetical protein [Baekduia alba]